MLSYAHLIKFCLQNSFNDVRKLQQRGYFLPTACTGKVLHNSQHKGGSVLCESTKAAFGNLARSELSYHSLVQDGEANVTFEVSILLSGIGRF